MPFKISTAAICILRKSNRILCYQPKRFWTFCAVFVIAPPPTPNTQPPRSQYSTAHVLHSAMELKHDVWKLKLVCTDCWMKSEDFLTSSVLPLQKPTGCPKTASRRWTRSASPRTSATRRISPRSLRWAARTVCAVAPRIMRTSGARRPPPHRLVRARNMRETSDHKINPLWSPSNFIFLRNFAPWPRFCL